MRERIDYFDIKFYKKKRYCTALCNKKYDIYYCKNLIKDSFAEIMHKIPFRYKSYDELTQYHQELYKT